MTDRRRHVGAEAFQITTIKNTMTSVASSSHIVPRAVSGLQPQFSREEGPVKTTQYTLLQLVNMVRENPILYDEELQATIPDAQLRAQKREVWDRIRNDIVWQDITLVQEVWSDLLDQYSRKSIEMSDVLLDAMRWTDSLINKKKGDSRPPSQLNPMSSALDKDFYTDVPLAEDVLEPGQSIGSSSPSLKFDYVVIQPSVGHVRTNSHQPIQTSSAQFTRRKSPSPRETEAIVRSYPLSPKRQNHRMGGSQDSKMTSHLVEVKKESPISYGRQPLLVEVESSAYGSSSPKMYKMITQRGSTPQSGITVTSRRIVHQLPHRTSNLNYDSMPELIEASSLHSEPPKKKMIIEHHHRSNTMVGPSSSISTSRLNGSMQNVRILNDVVPLADDEIILEADGECKLGASGLIMAAQQSSSSRSHEMNQGMPSTSDGSMHHYHHQDIEESGVVEDIEQQVAGAAQSEEMAIQYDEDLSFQQHINGVLNRLNDEDKSLMKFQMQKIILDARFGAGTARSMLKEDEMLEVDPRVEIDPGHVSNDDSM